MSDDLVRYPEQFLAQILQNHAQERIADVTANPTIFKRALVVAVDVVGGKLQNPGAAGNLTHSINNQTVTINAIDGPKNPANSIKARIITDGFDQFFSDESLRVFYPLLPEHMSVPIKPGEYALVMFEDAEYANGWWLGKVPGQEGLNLAKGQSFLAAKSNPSLGALFPDTAASAPPTENLATDEAAGEAPPNGKLTKLFSI